jgi:hypothetical protein
MHRIEVNVLTGEVMEIPLTPEEQAEYDAAQAQQNQTEEQPTTSGEVSE